MRHSLKRAHHLLLWISVPAVPNCIQSKYSQSMAGGIRCDKIDDIGNIYAESNQSSSVEFVIASYVSPSKDVIKLLAK